MRLRPVTRPRVRLENLLAIWTKLFPVCRESPPICKRCGRERRAQADDKGNELAVEINFRSRSYLTETDSSASLDPLAKKPAASRRKVRACEPLSASRVHPTCRLRALLVRSE